MKALTITLALIVVSALTAPSQASQSSIPNRCEAKESQGQAGRLSPAKQAPSHLVPIKRTIDVGQYSGLTRQAELVLKDQASWKRVWDEHVSNVMTSNWTQPALPQVDFKNEMVVAMFFGEGKNGHHGGSITQITETSTKILVCYLEDTSSGGITTMAITHPFHIVVIKRSDKPVFFMHATNTPKPQPQPPARRDPDRIEAY